MQTIGGQAVVEGVLMRSENYYSIACRRPSGGIVSKTIRFRSMLKRNRLLRLPFIRGILVLIESLILGIKALIYSSNQQLQKSGEKMSWKELLLTLGFAIIFALAIFKFLPLVTANIFKNLLGIGNVAFNLIEGVIKFAVFIVYLLIISSLKDIQIMFQYHGAEHKSVNCYEKGKALNIRNIKKYTTLQVRCGTSFLFMVILISILVYLAIPLQMNFWLKYLFRILLLPIIAGISYETIKLASKRPKWKLLQAIISPGLLIQKITTKEPTNRQIEVALVALKNVLKKEKLIN